MEQERQDQESLKRKYQQRLIELETDLEAQKTHMLAEFDNILRQREHEYRSRLDELTAVAEGREQRVHTLTRESAGLRREVESLQKDLKDKCEEKRRIEHQLQTDQWQHQEERSMCEAK